jgi:hypothetical protein
VAINGEIVEDRAGEVDRSRQSAALVKPPSRVGLAGLAGSALAGALATALGLLALG